jgi:hypothetical protein
MKQPINEIKRMQQLAGLITESEDFYSDFPELNYSDVTNFIKNQGYEITSDYYDGGFDVNNGDYFIGVFDDHISITDNEGNTEEILY